DGRALRRRLRVNSDSSLYRERLAQSRAFSADISEHAPGRKWRVSSLCQPGICACPSEGVHRFYHSSNTGYG
ncbi:bacterial regulatory helix-turn-helix, lysR family protein, partial [Vibrio parahaemolyticus AQ3810]